jgi:hypothetical protein
LGTKKLALLGISPFHKSWAHSVKLTQIWEKMQLVGRKAQIHDAKLGKKMSAECKFQA